jgi:hypothetical protein
MIMSMERIYASENVFKIIIDIIFKSIFYLEYIKILFLCFFIFYIKTLKKSINI